MTARTNPHFDVPPSSIEERRTIFESIPKRVRVKFNHKVLADSQHVYLLLETGHIPVYYFPEEDIRTEFLEPSGHKQTTDKGTAHHWHIQIGDRKAKNAVWAYPGKPEAKRPDLRGYRAFQWQKMDHWYVDDEEVFVHPRDPYSRIDIRRSSRHVKVKVDGTLVAESHRPLILYETGLPPRYYLPPKDVHGEFLKRSSTTTRCPYKGLASYWHIQVKDQRYTDRVWSYLTPLSEVSRIAGTFSFYHEKMEGFTVDGQPPQGD